MPRRLMPDLKTASPLKRRIAAVLVHPGADRALFALIVLSVGLLFIEAALPSHTPAFYVSQAIMVVFAIELSCRFYVARSKRAFFLVYWLDILSLVPLFGPWRLLRALRILRLFRLGNLLRRSNKRLASDLRRTFGSQLSLLLILLVGIMGIAFAMLAVEHGNPEFGSIAQTMWWTVFSMAAGEPVGAMPGSPVGRLLALTVMLGGMTVFAVLTGTVSAVMADRLQNGFRSNLLNLSDLEDHVIVCGWNRSGHVLLEELHHDRAMKDRSIVVIAEVRPKFSAESNEDPNLYYVEGDYTRPEVLQRCGVKRASTAILLADKSVPQRTDQDRDARTILAGLMIEKLSPGIFTCAELLSRENEQHLIMAGIEEIVIGDEYSGTILAASSRVRGITEIADEVFSNKYGNQIYKRAIHPEWVGRSFLAVSAIVKQEYDALLIAIEKAGGPGDEPNVPGRHPIANQTITNPPADYVFGAGDRLITFCSTEPEW